MTAGELHLCLQSLPVAHITISVPPSVGSAAALDSHRIMNSKVNCACEGSRLCAPYENLMSEDLRPGAEVVMLALGSGCKYR